LRATIQTEFRIKKNNKPAGVVKAINTTNRSECMHAPKAINYAGTKRSDLPQGILNMTFLLPSYRKAVMELPIEIPIYNDYPPNFT
jgi:hypothetical protein